MRKVILACVAAASLAGCSMGHRDRGMESSGATTSPGALGYDQPGSKQGATSGNQAGMNWNKCDEHPYLPGPSRKCE